MVGRNSAIFLVIYQQMYIIVRISFIIGTIIQGRVVCTMKKSVSILLVGKSGAGKSKFISSFAAHRDQIEASGKGQTTRTIVEYHFSINEPSPKVTVEYLSEDEFVEKRLAKEPKVPKEKYDESICEQILVTEGFFNYKEFNFVDEANSKKIEALWTGILHTHNKEEKALTNDYTKEQLTAVADYLKSQFAEGLTLKIADKKAYNLNDLVELYLKAVYRCTRVIKLHNSLFKFFIKSFLTHKKDTSSLGYNNTYLTRMCP